MNTAKEWLFGMGRREGVANGLLGLLLVLVVAPEKGRPPDQ